ncbi:hypothetical protein [Sabulicella rubraurantiaca]|uniref:hypothetical protein n=1 Tax=Sabulicella rubraurantiaca TaxID=2811429 RepID=UPI001A97815F|nr:hypothetical protein [Sabulicella rubraurantiaca]
MPDWKTRLVVSFQVDGATTVISPIDQFSPTFSLGAEPLHSVERTHIGVVYQPRSLTFSLTVRAIGGVVGQLTALALRGTPFDILLQEQEGDDWTFSAFVMRRCVITSAQPGAATISGAPSATFSGFSLETTVDPKIGEPVTV